MSEDSRKSFGGGAMGSDGQGIRKTRKEPDYEYWVKADYWKISEAVHLLHDVEPGYCKFINDTIKSYDKPLEKQLKKTYLLVKRSSDHSNMMGPDRIKSSEFLNWAREKGFDIPEPLSHLLRAHGVSSGDIPPYLDENHEHFAPELLLAVHAWLELYNSDNTYIKEHKGEKEQIRNWLKEKHGVESDRELDRISTVILPKKRKGGGTPRIGED